MLRKSKTLYKRALSFLLSILIILSVMPFSVFAASENLGKVAGGKTMDIDVSWHYGHQLHTTKVDGTTYPMFCIEYGTTSPETSYLKARKAGANANVIKAAKWIFAGYYMEHGNSVDWLDMAYCQKKVWSIMGDSTSWEFSSDGYDKWIDKAEKNMESLDTKPSFDKTNVGTITAGTSKTITDSNKVFKDYPAFTVNKNGIKMEHEADTNKLTITIDKTCTKTSFKINNGDYYKENTGDDDELLLFYPYGSEDYQKLVYSAYYDPISFALDGDIEVLGSAKLKKTSEDGKVSGIKFTVTSDDFSKTMTTDSNGEWELDYLVPGKYTVTEESIERYVTPSSKTITVKSGETATVSFSNVLKKFRVTANKEDAEKKNAQGDASLAGAKYGIYNNGTLVDTYTTDANGKFTTAYYVCGNNWTIKEISPSEGYLLDKTVYNVGAEAKLYTVEHNTTSNTVKEQVIKGNISIIKHSDDGSTQIETPEPEAEFQVYLKSAGSYANADADERDVLDCDNDGFAKSKDLPYGVYTVHQTKGVDGSEFMQDFDVFISENGKTYKYLINNAPFKAYLKITKVDKETGKAVAYAGAGFEIYDSSGKKVSQTFTYPKKTTISTYYTNSEGYLITPEKLDYGKGYSLVEVQAPYGYVLDNTPIKFNVTRDNSEYEDALTLIKVERDNVAQKGVIEITKSGEVFSSAENTNDIYTPVYEVKSLKGAVYDVYAAEDIKTPDGTLRYQQGEQMDEITTGDDGIAKTKPLYLGKYTLVEKTAPDTFYNSGQQHDVELVYAGQDVEITSTALSAFNERQRVKLSLSKSLEKDKIYNIGSNGEIEAVQFGIYSAVDVTAADGTVIPANSLITIRNCDKDGNIVFDCDLPIGFIWYAQEITTDKHYVLSNEQYFFDTMYAGQNVETLDIKVCEGNTIENKLIYGKVKGYKIDRETQKPIKNVEFGIFKGDETEFTYKTAITTVKTDKNGVFEFNNVPFGAWIIRELKPAKDYLTYTDIHHIEIDRNEKVIEMHIFNDKIPELKTTAFVDGKKTVSTKKPFTITDTVEYQHLIPGKEYTVKGVLMDKSTGKELIIDGKTVKSELTFVPKTPNGSIDILFTVDGKFITKTTDIVVFETLYKEGVELASHADIKDKDQTVKITVPKKPNPPSKTHTPKTGDESNRRTLATILGASLFGIMCLAYTLLRKRKNSVKEDNDNEC